MTHSFPIRRSSDLMFVNIKLMAKLKVKYRNKHFILRSFISSSIGELIVTCLAYPLIFMKLNTSIVMLMINAYLFKVFYSFIGAYPAKLLDRKSTRLNSSH